MKKYALISLCLLLALVGLSQNASLVFNNNPFLVMNGGTSGAGNQIYLVIDNPNGGVNGGIDLQTSQTYGGIVSESEYNRVKWNVGATTGTYLVPFTKPNLGTPTSSNPVPTTVTITSGGNSGGSLVLSTDPSSTWDNNADRPSFIGNYNSSIGGSNNSAKVIDRTWIVDASSYTTKPTGTLTLSYTDSEYGGSNTIGESFLQAQSYDETGGNWDETAIQGTWANGSGNFGGSVSAIAFTPTTLNRGWTLVDNRSPLPISLTSFDVVCDNKQININWVTASETNNNYFTIEKSNDGINTTVVGIIKGNGTTTEKNTYTFVDTEPTSEVTYYRLKQTDFDGKFEYFDMKSVSCNVDNFTGVNVYPNPNMGYKFNLAVNTFLGSEMLVVITDVNGREYYSKVLISEFDGNNVFVIGLDKKLNHGVYIITATSNNVVYNKRLIVN